MSHQVWGITYLLPWHRSTSICCCHASWMRSTSSAESRRPLFTWDLEQLLSLCSCYTIIFIHTSPHVSMFALAMPVWAEFMEDFFADFWRRFCRLGLDHSDPSTCQVPIISNIIPGTSILILENTLREFGIASGKSNMARWKITLQAVFPLSLKPPPF